MLVLQQLWLHDGMWLMATCSNCEKEIALDNTAVTVCGGNPRGLLLGDICADCTENVLTMKLVFKREGVKEDFKFEQYLPVESVKR
jgi:hypothetical protein